MCGVHRLTPVKHIHALQPCEALFASLDRIGSLLPCPAFPYSPPPPPLKVHRLSHDTRALMESEEPDEMEMQPLEAAGRGVDD